MSWAERLKSVNAASRRPPTILLWRTVRDRVIRRNLILFCLWAGVSAGTPINAVRGAHCGHDLPQHAPSRNYPFVERHAIGLESQRITEQPNLTIIGHTTWHSWKSLNREALSKALSHVEGNPEPLP